MTRIAIVGAGEMGSGIGQLLGSRGCEVISPLAGRSAGSHERARRAGMVSVALDELASADLILSIVPPGQAAAVADRLAPVLGIGQLFIDANALAPETKRELATAIELAGGRMADGVIIGSPPREGHNGPRLYVSGEHAPGAELLREYGLDVRVLDGPVGTAAALKMCYGAFNKGITALTTAVLLAARRSGADQALLDEFGISQQFLLKRSRSAVPQLYPKAHRWIAEFDEIASFTHGDPASSQIFEAIARFFEDRARAYEIGTECADLETMLAFNAPT